MARRPSARAHDGVLEAAQELIAQKGVEATSMDAIAEISGVSKATIYKHWKDKNALCLEVLSRCLGESTPWLNTGDVRADIIAVLGHRPHACKSSVWTRMMPHFAAYAHRDVAFGQAWRAKILKPPRLRLSALLRRAVAEGQLRIDLNIELGVALLLGPMMYRHAMECMNVSLPPETAELVVDAFWRAHGRED